MKLQVTYALVFEGTDPVELYRAHLRKLLDSGFLKDEESAKALLYLEVKDEARKQGMTEEEAAEYAELEVA